MMIFVNPKVYVEIDCSNSPLLPTRTFEESVVFIHNEQELDDAGGLDQLEADLIAKNKIGMIFLHDANNLQKFANRQFVFVNYIGDYDDSAKEKIILHLKEQARREFNMVLP